ncbi:PPOX class F420-dependent oxidoreductase [Planotetraspora thailandica]|uniref:PPOX class F420-dependent oxidoreductase n=1 Tax=Planotetraspora thailandica TaxID=487172 RepID=A0A8J3XUC5_9ACTN|nr:TIGR03668 family PPOX class F420-dependent oxidoreductase [Planotetraspora thailandica]GII52506.1 PPOX class F420-dependent oxidoreductase [Planotetraspora thailandica]
MPQDRARALFTRARVARLATAADAQSGPRVVPVTFAVVPGAGRDTVVSVVDDKPKTTMNLRRLRDIAANPRVCLLADHYEDDWERLWWARADGLARVVDAGAERDLAVERLAEKYPQYRARLPRGPAVLVEVARWSGWAYADDPGAAEVPDI